MDKEFNPVEHHQKREKERENFFKDKRYMYLIEGLISKSIDNDDYQEPKVWTDEVDDMFSFLYNYAYDIIPFDEEVIVRHDNNFISLFEMHGQGCYRRIDTVTEPVNYVKFEDIVTYYETGKKPYKSEVMKVVNRALDVLEVALGDITTDLIKIDEVRDYIKNNLK